LRFSGFNSDDSDNFYLFNYFWVCCVKFSLLEVHFLKSCSRLVLQTQIFFCLFPFFFLRIYSNLLCISLCLLWLTFSLHWFLVVFSFPVKILVACLGVWKFFKYQILLRFYSTFSNSVSAFLNHPNIISKDKFSPYSQFVYGMWTVTAVVVQWLFWNMQFLFGRAICSISYEWICTPIWGFFCFFGLEKRERNAEKLKQSAPFQNSNIYISLEFLNMVRLKKILEIFFLRCSACFALYVRHKGGWRMGLWDFKSFIITWWWSW
jgi:hypothetical protein